MDLPAFRAHTANAAKLDESSRAVHVKIPSVPEKQSTFISNKQWEATGKVPMAILLFPERRSLK